MVSNTEHLKISELPQLPDNPLDGPYRPYQGASAFRHETPREPPKPPVVPLSLSLTDNLTRWLLLSGSTSLLGLNFVMGTILVRDMLYNGYNATNHYFMTSAFAMTIGILAVIHNWLIKKD